MKSKKCTPKHGECTKPVSCADCKNSQPRGARLSYVVQELFKHENLNLLL